MKAPKITVLCVDDSATIRELLTAIIGREPDMEVVAVAPDPLVARDLIKQHAPDVLTLDIKMPRMDGLEFLERLMRLRPMPVLMVSSRTHPGTEETRRAIALGARDVIGKPRLGIRQGMEEDSTAIVNKIRAAATTQPLLRSARPAPCRSASIRLQASVKHATDAVFVIGASTGGTEAIRAVLDALPADGPPVLIAQHMPAGFTRTFAKRLNETSPLLVKEAQDHEPLLQGHAYVAPGDRHLKIACREDGYATQLDDGPEVNRHRPAVDVLFRSAAQVAGPRASGVLLTGMGKDGAAGLLALRESGALTLAQDEASSVIFGMPREAIAIGAASEVIALEGVAARLVAGSTACADRRHVLGQATSRPWMAAPHSVSAERRQGIRSAPGAPARQGCSAAVMAPHAQPAFKPFWSHLGVNGRVATDRCDDRPRSRFL